MVARHLEASLDWNQRYSRYNKCFGDEPTPFVREVLSSRRLADQSLLFPGDGYGRHGLWAAQRGASVIALDGSRIAVEMALSEAHQRGLRYVSTPCDLSLLPFPVWGGHRFDMVVSAWFRIEGDGADLQRTWNCHATQLLKPGGTIVQVGSRAMGSPTTEAALWPSGITWTDHSTAEEARLLGRKPSAH